MRKKDNEEYPLWMVDFVKGDKTKADRLIDEFYYFDEPFVESQYHYDVKETATKLKLSPVTVRQYIRENKIFARKIDERWQIPVDAIVRYIYMLNNKHKPDKNVPMGFIRIKERNLEGNTNFKKYVMAPLFDDSNRKVGSYRTLNEAFMGNDNFEEYILISDKELGTIINNKLLPDDFYDFFNIDKDKYLLSDLYATNTFSFSKNKPREEIHDEFYNFSKNIKKQLDQLSEEKWHAMPLPILKGKYKQLFGKEPDINDIKLFKTALAKIQLDNSFPLSEALLSKMVESYYPRNSIIYAFNRMALSVIPEKLLQYAEDIIAICESKNLFDAKEGVWKGPISNSKYNMHGSWEEFEVDELLGELDEFINTSSFKQEYKKLIWKQ
ncbi:MAG: helix-turn-helix domain-containing protein [bacterium]